MKRISFLVFAIWIFVYLVVWYFFKYFKNLNYSFLYYDGIDLDVRWLIAYLFQFIGLTLYFTFIQKENIKFASLRALIFNSLLYFVYFLLIWRANQV